MIDPDRRPIRNYPFLHFVPRGEAVRDLPAYILELGTTVEKLQEIRKKNGRSMTVAVITPIGEEIHERKAEEAAARLGEENLLSPNFLSSAEGGSQV
jgi:hypothetical protein